MPTNLPYDNLDRFVYFALECLLVQSFYTVLNFSLLAKGFDKLLVTDVDPQPLRGVDNQGYVRIWNNRPAQEEGHRYTEFVPGAHTHEVFSNRNPHVSSSVHGHNFARQGSHGPTGRNTADDQRGNTNRSTHRGDQYTGGNRGARRPSNDGRRNGGQPPQQSRVWNGNCYLCGMFFLCRLSISLILKRYTSWLVVQSPSV